MEDTYSLLSTLVQTKSIESVLAPIAAQVSQLIIVNEAYENGDKNAFPADLLPSATHVMKSTEGLVEAASRLAEQSTDLVLQSDMPRACQTLSVAGMNLITATQRVEIENFSVTARRHLIRTAKDVLEGTLKVLLVSDDAEIRKMKYAMNCARDRLAVLTAVQTMKHLVSAFKGFTKSVMLLTNLLDKRQLELNHPRQRESLLLALSTLKKYVPMLNTSLQTFVKYPQNDQAKASKLYVIGQIMECLDMLEATIQSKDIITEDYEEPEMPGHFVSNVDKILDLLCEERRLQLAQMGSELDTIIEALVRHSMSVSHLSTGQHRTGIIRSAQMLLKKRSEISAQSETVISNPELAELQSDFHGSCESVIMEAQTLERLVNGAVLQLVIDVFKETTQPLERMIKAMLTTPDESSRPINMDSFVKDFHEHYDKMTQVSRYIAATSLDAKKVRMINNCLCVLESVDPEIIPAIMACNGHADNQAAIEHLRLLKTEWTNTLGILLRTIDELIDGKLFIEVSESEIRREAIRCRQSMFSDNTTIADVTRSLIGRSRRVAHRATKLIDSHIDPVYRNGVMAYVKRLNKAIPDLKSAANAVLETPGSQESHETFHKCCDSLLECITHIQDTVLGKSSPDILDPIRQNVRPLHPSNEDELLDEDGGNRFMYLDNDHHKSTQITKRSKQVQAEAAKSYVADIIHDHLSDLSQGVVSAAIGGHTQRLDLLCNTVLTNSNHLTEIANMVITYIPDTDNRRVVEKATSCVMELTPQILDKARRVLACDTYQIDPLHEVTDSWAKQMSFLESRIDGVLTKWKAVSERLQDAVCMADRMLLQAQSDYIREHATRVETMLCRVMSLADSMDVVTKEKTSVIQTQARELEKLTASLITMAEQHIKSKPNSEDKLELSQAVCRWAALIYCVISAIDRLSAQAVATLYRPITLHTDFTQLSPHISAVTHQTLELKGLIQAVITGCKDKNRASEATGIIQEVDRSSADITQCHAVVTGASLPTHNTEAIYAVHNMGLLLWEWAKHVQTVRAMLHRWIAPCTHQMELFLQNIHAYHNTKSDDDRSSEEIKCKRFIVSVRETFQKVRGRVLDMIQPSDDIDGKNGIRRHLEKWADITQEVEEAARALIDNFEGSTKEFSQARLRWGVKCLEVDACLQTLFGIKYTSISEFVKSVKPHDTGASSNGRSPLTDGASQGVHSAHTTNNMNKTPNSDVTDSVKPRSEQSWQKLASGPKVHHNTPAKSDNRTGYTPQSNKSYDMQGSPFYRYLECDKWEDGNNAIVKIAREISQQLQDMTAFTKCTGPIQSKKQMISTAKAVAKNGEELVKFARVLVKYSIDKRVADDLRCSADYMPTVIAQLNILASVKAVAPEDRSTEKMLVKTGGNLLEAINKMLRNAEATCIKGLKSPADADIDETESLVLATQWHRRFQRHRLMEYTTATVDQLGLRKISSQVEAPTLTNIMKP